MGNAWLSAGGAPPAAAARRQQQQQQQQQQAVPVPDFRRCRALLEQHVAPGGLAGGVQLSVRAPGGGAHVDLFAGRARTAPRCGAPRGMSAESVLDWQSTTKPLAAVAVALLHERGQLDVFAPVARYVPRFASRGKGAVTLAHLLMHTAGIPFAAFQLCCEEAAPAWEAVVAACCDERPSNAPGERAAYHSFSMGFVLAEVVERVSGRRFAAFVRDEIFAPLGIDPERCAVGLGDGRLGGGAQEAYERMEPHLAELVEHERDASANLGFERVAACDPAGGGRAAARELVRVFECLAQGGAPLLKRETVELFTKARRVGMVDDVQGVECDWTLGFCVDSVLGGGYAPKEAFGHGGSRSSFAVSDPVNGVAYAYAATWKVASSKEHYERVAAVADAVYLDLGMANEGLTEYREHALPAY